MYSKNLWLGIRSTFIKPQRRWYMYLLSVWSQAVWLTGVNVSHENRECCREWNFIERRGVLSFFWRGLEKGVGRVVSEMRPTTSNQFCAGCFCCCLSFCRFRFVYKTTKKNLRKCIFHYFIKIGKLRWHFSDKERISCCAESHDF